MGHWIVEYKYRHHDASFLYSQYKFNNWHEAHNFYMIWQKNYNDKSYWNNSSESMNLPRFDSSEHSNSFDLESF